MNLLTRTCELLHKHFYRKIPLMGKPLALLIMGIFVAILSACGGGGDSGGTSNGSNQSENVTATDSEVVANLK